MIALLVVVTTSHAATFTVSTAVDVVDPADPFLSFREALAAVALGDTIVFSTAVFPTGTRTAIPVTIGPLQVLVDDIQILGDGRVTLDGALAPAGSSGLEIGGAGVVVTGLEIVGFPNHGVHVNAGSDHVIGGVGALGNLIRDNEECGIRVGASPVNTENTEIVGNTIDGNCVAPVGVCAGVMVLGSAPSTS